MVVGQESVLTFAGQTITNDGLIEILGGSDIAAGVTFTGSGIVALESGGQMTIGQRGGHGDVALRRRSTSPTARARSPWSMPRASRHRGLSDASPAVRIDLTRIQAQSARYFRPTSASQPGHSQALRRARRPGRRSWRTLDDGAASSAGNLGRLGSTSRTFRHRTSRSAATATGGTLVTYTPQNGIQLQQSLAAPIVATAGTDGVVREHPAERLRHVLARLHQHHAAAQRSRSPTPASTPATGARPTSRRHGW